MSAVNQDHSRQVKAGTVYGIASALLFGASTPLSKLLLPAVAPVMLAALLYLGAAALTTLFRLSSFLGRRQSADATLRKSDLPALCGIIVLGGVLGSI